MDLSTIRHIPVRADAARLASVSEAQALRFRRVFASAGYLPSSPEDYVCGMTNSTATLVQFSVQRPFHNILDLGTGCGVLGFLATRCSRGRDSSSRPVRARASPISYGSVTEREHHANQSRNWPLMPRFLSTRLLRVASTSYARCCSADLWCCRNNQTTYPGISPVSILRSLRGPDCAWLPARRRD